ncbi:MAG TPA: flavodoxin family protein [Deltaproteobacteria bacterium]|nr:flavodoxin family protein [Deltaproteobacteria bacterium]
MTYHVIGISGSPVKGGNVETFLQRMLDVASASGASAEAIHLSNVEVRECIHCNFCLNKQKPGRYCSLRDDAQQIFEKIGDADIIVLASPVYFMRTSGAMASFIDRLRVFMYGNITGGGLKNKIGVSAAVSWLRNAGLETTHLSHILAFMTLGMIPVSTHGSVSPLGASAVSSSGGAGIFEQDIGLGTAHDEPGLKSADAVMERALELARLIRKNI